MVINVSAINGMVKISLVVAALAASLLLGASSPIKNTGAEREPQKTELLSKDKAEALKLNPLQQTQQTVPTVHNPKINDLYLRLALTKEDSVALNDYFSNMYSELGTYIASAVIQASIDKTILLNYLDGNKDIFKNFNNEKLNNLNTNQPFMTPIYEKKDKIIKWYDEVYEPALYRALSSDHKLSAQEVENALINFMKTCGLTNANYVVAYIDLDYYQTTHSMKYYNSVLSHSNYIAYITRIIDEQVFEQFLNLDYEPAVYFGKWFSPIRDYYALDYNQY